MLLHSVFHAWIITWPKKNKKAVIFQLLAALIQKENFYENNRIVNSFNIFFSNDDSMGGEDDKKTL